MSDLVLKEPGWIWPERIQLEDLTVLFGEPSGPQRLVATDIMARASRGAVFPGVAPPSFQPSPVEVLLVVDSFAQRVVYREQLSAAGADLQRVHFSQIHDDYYREGSLDDVDRGDSPNPLSAIQTVLRIDPRIKLVVIDCLDMMVIGGRRKVKLQRLLLNLCWLAECHQVAVLVVQSLTGKARWGHELRQLGPDPFLGVPRTIWGLGRRTPDPRSPQVMYPLLLRNRAQGIVKEFEIREGRVWWSDREDPASTLRSNEPFRRATGQPGHLILGGGGWIGAAASAGAPGRTVADMGGADERGCGLAWDTRTLPRRPLPRPPAVTDRVTGCWFAQSPADAESLLKA
ncbi:MAG: hypothetical protein ACKOFW_23865 [Planctomycetaceae bacterium]